MAIAGTLTVNVLAKTDTFQKGITAARTKLGAFQKSVRSVAGGINSFAGALTGIAVGGGLAAFAAQTVESIDRLNKLSEQLGISTEDLGKLTFQADLAGVTQEQLATALKRFSRVISDADVGLTSALRPFERLNINVRDLLEQSPARQFQMIAEAIQQIENPTQRSATAMELFGRSGAELLPLLNSNLAESAKRFKDLGLEVSKVEADQISAFQDAVTELKTAIGARGRDFVIGITPAALEAVKGLEVVMDNLGITRPQETAFESAVRERRGRRGSTFHPERIRRGIVDFLGETFADFSGDPRGLRRSRQVQELRNIRRGRETGSVAEFREAARQRAEEIRNSKASLDVQRQMLRALQEQTGIQLEPATFN